MKKGKWIWCDSPQIIDTYGEFIDCITVSNNHSYSIDISSSSYFALYINDSLISFSHCSDYPNKKLFNHIEINKYLLEGENQIVIQVWNEGLDTQRAFKEEPGLIYEIKKDNEIVSYSSKKALSRRMDEYKNEYQKVITSQLGYSFFYDCSYEKGIYSFSKEINKECSLARREISELQLQERQPIKIKRLENSILIDLGKEMAGFIELELVSKIKQNLLIAYGEHIKDGHVRRKISSRDFSVEYIVKNGINKHLNPFRRIAGRYLEIFAEDLDLDIKYCGIRDVLYPVSVLPFDFHDQLLNQIYQISVRTLQLCMHEHYEDCPWREQCLYALDSMNQIRCGYYCFKDGNLPYVKHNLLLLNNSLREDGLLSICAPSGLDLPIPSFSLAFIIESIEYFQKSNDIEFLNSVKTTINAILRAFISRIDETGLIPEFKKSYWDFYEWADYSDGSNKDNSIRYSSILNLLFLYTYSFAKPYINISFDIELFKKKISSSFKKENIIYLDDKLNYASQTSCALGILNGIGNKDTALEIINNKDLIPTTLSMKVFVYDALLSFEGQFDDVVINDIIKNYSSMIDDGATSFYETIKGDADFSGAGSLCHGWSAIPIIYLNKLLKK